MLSQRALDRRIKRQFNHATQQFAAICPPAFVPMLQDELRALGYRAQQPFEGGVSFEASRDAIYYSNLHLRCAHRVLLRIKEDFLSQNYAMLFDHARRIPWEVYVGRAGALRISVVSKQSFLRYPKPITDTLHEAIQARLEPLGLAVRLEPTAPLHLMVRLYQDHCTLSFDSSGTHLHKRGYRTHVGKAPIRETLAAGVLRWLMQQGLDLLALPAIVDPFCGSGTLLIEAEQLLRNFPAGSQRSFAFEHMPLFQASKWQRLRTHALEAALPSCPIPLYGSDYDAHALEAAAHNARCANCGLELRQAEALSRDYPPIPGSLLLSNPPYGARLAEDTKQIQAHLRQLLHQLPPNYHACLIMPQDWRIGTPQAHLYFRNGNMPVQACYYAPR